MLYKIDYTTRNEQQAGSKWVDLVPDSTEAVTRFMDWFFRSHNADAVRVDLITNVEIVGDPSGLDLIETEGK